MVKNSAKFNHTVKTMTTTNTFFRSSILYNFSGVGIFMLLLTSCLRKELPVTPHEAGDVLVAGVDMDPLYKYQIYYDLKTNTVVGKNEKTIWDLGFETTADGYHVVLNSARAMYAMQANAADFGSVSFADTAGFAENRRWDSPTGSWDSTAVGDWRTKKPVYIIDRGFDPMGKHQGWAKLQLTAVTDSSYNISFANLTDGVATHLQVKKDSLYNLSFVSLTTNQQLTVEPPKQSWDLVFTQYTFVFYDQIPVTPYLVTGCLLNRYNTTAYLDTVSDFTSLGFASVNQDLFLADMGVIGYDWKAYNGVSYAIRTKNKYLIRDAEGMVYKLRFTGFYNAQGAKGSPQWEYQRL